MNKLIEQVVKALIISFITWLTYTVYNIDKETTLINYKLEQYNTVLQDLYELKKNKD